jgi:hypothetical protein
MARRASVKSGPENLTLSIQCTHLLSRIYLAFGPVFAKNSRHPYMGSLKKRRKAKINKHKRRKKLRLNRHKKRTWQK